MNVAIREKMAETAKADTAAPANISNLEQERVERLIAAARDGEHLAFEELMRLFRADVYRVALGLMGNPEEAADVTQDVFMRLYRSLGRLDAARGIRAWLRRVAVNRCYDLLRLRNRTQQIDEQLQPGCMQISDASGDPEIARLLQQCMDVLAPRERAALTLTCQLGLSSVEAGESMGCAPETVRVLTFKARDKIKTLLSPQSGGWSM